MKALAYDKYGSPDVLEVREIERPVVTDDGVLVRIHAASVNPVDLHIVLGTPYLVRLQAGLRKPKSEALGVDFAGTVEEVGSNVKQFQPGDEVFGARNGSFAEYVCVREDRPVVHKPAGVTFEQAAAVPVAAISALQGLRDKGQVQPGQRVLINGASGGVGTFAVQLAKSFGARVTGVCSTGNVDLVGSLGGDRVVDYTQEDFTKLGERHELMLDIAGSRSFLDFKRVLTPEATVVMVGGLMTYRGHGPLPHFVGTFLKSRGRSQKVTLFVAKITKEDLAFLCELLGAGTVKSVIDRKYELSRAS